MKLNLDQFVIHMFVIDNVTKDLSLKCQEWLSKNFDENIFIKFQVICKKTSNGYFWLDPEGYPELLSEPILGPCEAFNLDFGNLADENPDEGDDFDELDALSDKENESWGDGSWEKPNWSDENLEKPNWADESEEKIPVTECPAIESDPNEAATGPKCNEYLCGRNCNEGFEPTYPFKVSF